MPSLPTSGVARRAAVVASVVAATSLPTAAFAANAPGDNGDVKIHESTTDPQDKRDEPKVCKFYVVGFGFDANHDLHYEIVKGPNFKDKPVLKGDIDVDDKGFGRSGDLTLPDGQYKLFTTFVGENGKAKQKVFKVDCPDAADEPVTPTDPQDDPPAETQDEPPAETQDEPPAETQGEPPAETQGEPPAETQGEPPAETQDEPPAETQDEPPAQTQDEPPAEPQDDPEAAADPDAPEVLAVNQPQAAAETGSADSDTDTAQRPAGGLKTGGGGMAGAAGAGPSDLPVALFGGALVLVAGAIGGRAWLRR